MSAPKDPFPQRTVTDRQIRNRTLRSFVVFGLLLAAGWYGWSRLYHAKYSGPKDQVQAPLRKSLELNRKLFTGTFDTSKKAQSFTKAQAVKRVRVNGNIGMSGSADTGSWRMELVRAPGDTLRLTLGDIRRLPKTEVIFDFKCIEGWDQVTRWAGVRMTDFIRAYQLDAQASKKYIGLATPDREYYVGIDMPSALQSQTILCYEMNGAPLPDNQGFPLRLIIPVKYGIKHLKRIGTMYFSDTPPPDYWAERGYDYHSGH